MPETHEHPQDDHDPLTRDFRLVCAVTGAVVASFHDKCDAERYAKVVGPCATLENA